MVGISSMGFGCEMLLAERDMAVSERGYMIDESRARSWSLAFGLGKLGMRLSLLLHERFGGTRRLHVL